MEELPPIEGNHCAQSRNYVLEGISLDDGRFVRSAEEGAAEVVERAPPLRLLADGHIRVQPNQDTLWIEICPATEGCPLRRREIKDLGGPGGIRERSPSPAGAMIKRGNHFGQILSRFGRRPQSATCREDRAQVGCEPFIHPQKFTFHRLLKIRSGQAFRTPVLSVPRMRELVGKKSRLEQTFVGID